MTYRLCTIHNRGSERPSHLAQLSIDMATWLFCKQQNNSDLSPPTSVDRLEPNTSRVAEYGVCISSFILCLSALGLSPLWLVFSGSHLGQIPHNRVQLIDQSRMVFRTQPPSLTPEIAHFQWLGVIGHAQPSCCQWSGYRCPAGIWFSKPHLNCHLNQSQGNHPKTLRVQVCHSSSQVFLRIFGCHGSTWPRWFRSWRRYLWFLWLHGMICGPKWPSLFDMQTLGLHLVQESQGTCRWGILMQNYAKQKLQSGKLTPTGRTHGKKKKTLGNQSEKSNKFSFFFSETQHLPEVMATIFFESNPNVDSHPIQRWPQHPLRLLVGPGQSR